ncbi:YD repeat-containing protein [Streptomyces turgidiscabies]|uniref:YD repeat-containing protein n=1 Tax=Streptomyces turgidiscabies TaxID=85558 RepID=A0ABU0S069_9ACTN|nr:YD repeat-containing protein [Streptomyces turgidiscabies]
MVDLNPLHYINKFNHMFGDSVASGLEFLGISDPAVDPDGIREIAKKWRQLATGLEDASAAADGALADVVWEGKAAKAFHKRSKAAGKSATEMAHSLREGAKALDDFADKAHELLSEIGVILAEIVEFEIAGLALSILTAGASEVASTLLAGERALKVIALIGRIEEEGTALGSVVRGVLEIIRNVERALKALKEIRGVAAVGKMAMDGAKFSAFETLLKDPAAFTDPEKLAGILSEGALVGIGFGVLGKTLGKGLKALKPSELAKLAKALKLGGNDLSRLKLRPGEAEELEAAIQAAEKECKLDPIDVATGDMLLPQTDVELPGVLPLLLRRTHISSYRCGGWFGPSWASTLDQRLQADDDSVTYAAPDGSRLVYPLLASGTDEPVYPKAGPRMPLSWDTEVDGALRLLDPGTGVSYVFHTPGPADDGNAVELPLQFVVDRNGHRITVQYADNGTPVGFTHSGGYRIAIDRHRELPRVAGLRLLDPDGADSHGTTLLTYGYDTDGHLTEITNSSGLPLRFTYDAEERITSWTDRNNTSYTYTYDVRGRVVRAEGSGGYLSGTLAYDDVTRSTTTTDALGNVTQYEHDEALRLGTTTGWRRSRRRRPDPRPRPRPRRRSSTSVSSPSSRTRSALPPNSSTRTATSPGGPDPLCGARRHGIGTPPRTPRCASRASTSTPKPVCTTTTSATTTRKPPATSPWTRSASTRRRTPSPTSTTRTPCAPPGAHALRRGRCHLGRSRPLRRSRTRRPCHRHGRHHRGGHDGREDQPPGQRAGLPEVHEAQQDTPARRPDRRLEQGRGLTLNARGSNGFSFTPYEGGSATNSVTILNVPKY